MQPRFPAAIFPISVSLLAACGGATREQALASPHAAALSMPPGYPAPPPVAPPSGLAPASMPAAESRAMLPIRSAPASAGRPIAAGEWDDNANYREFEKWLATSEGLPFHRIDVRQRRFVVVQDASGKAVPGCRVTVVDAEQHRTSLMTSASGRALLFPRAEGLQGDNLRATAECGRSTATAAFSVADADGVVDLKLSAARELPARRAIDVAFVLDTTGSMSEEIAAVKSTIRKVSSSLGREGLDVRIGLVAYKDRGDDYVTKTYPMTSDLTSFAGQVAQLYAAGGGDVPESVNEGLHVALTRLDWDPGALGRYAFLVGDAPPHLDYAQDFDYAADVRDAAHRGIQVFTIAASGMDGLGQVVWRQIAQYTNARNLFVLRGGAGPQSTGAGDPKSSCGGTQTRFTSDNLDALIVSDIEREMAGLDADPLRIAGLGRDEDAKPCNERLIARD